MLRFLLPLTLAAAPALAHDRLMPTASCTQIVTITGTEEAQALNRYLYFVYVAVTQTTPKASNEFIGELRQNTAKACQQLELGTSLEDAIRAVTKSALNGTPTTPKVSLDDSAHALLKKFLEPGADRRALTQTLMPSEADISAIFTPDFAPKVADYVAEVFGSGSVSPKDGYTEILVTVANTSELIDGGPALAEFPGGYKRLRPFLQRGIPIVRFKFVEPGETLGLAFDGLYRVNDRWVLIPKAWRLVEQ